jgi:hypothetical protein
MVACEVCGLAFDASLRSARDYRAGRAEPRCMLHRKRKPLSKRTTIATYRRWWLDRFTLEEIIEMATAMWPRDAQRKAGLLASAPSERAAE